MGQSDVQFYTCLRATFVLSHGLSLSPWWRFWWQSWTCEVCRWKSTGS